MTDLESMLLSAVRSAGRKTNLRDLQAPRHQLTPEQRLGYTLQQLPNNSSRDLPLGFDPIQALYIDKLVSEESLKKPVKLKREDFFKGILVLDYASNVFFGEFGIFTKILKIQREIERNNPDDDLDIRGLIENLGIYYLTQYQFYGRDADEQSRARYGELNLAADTAQAGLVEVSPLYEGLGKMVLESINNEQIRNHLPSLDKRYDIKAAIFVDAMISVLRNDGSKEEILGYLGRKDYHAASLMGILTMSTEYVRLSRDRPVGAGEGSA